jgi:hypothetical protein
MSAYLSIRSVTRCWVLGAFVAGAFVVSGCNETDPAAGGGANTPAATPAPGGDAAPKPAPAPTPLPGSGKEQIKSIKGPRS